MSTNPVHAFNRHEPLRADAPQAVRLQKKLIWAYFLLLIFEGALRKWALPSLATPLLIVREPVAAGLILVALRNGLFPSHPILYGMLLAGVGGFFATLFAGHGSIPVAIYGCRVPLLHLPAMFIAGATLTRRDVILFAKVTLLISIPMAMLLVAQFYSPQSAWVNRGVGGNTEGAGFGGAMGYFRPPGTFSFTVGTTLFFGFASCFVFYFWLSAEPVSKLLLWLATAALLIAIPVSISRGLLFQVVIIFFFGLLAGASDRKNWTKLISTTAGLLLIVALFSQTTIFENSTAAFTKRFETASSNEGGLQGTLGDRYLGGMLSALTGSQELPFWGYGAGMGSNVGSMLLTGSVQYLLAEGEWGRMAGEFGPLIGIAIILLRLALSWRLLTGSLYRLKSNDTLPWTLLAFALLIIPQGNTAQPTSLGFLVMIGGLLIACLNSKPPSHENH